MRPLPVILIGITLMKLAVLAALYSLRLAPADPEPEHEEGPASVPR